MTSPLGGSLRAWRLVLAAGLAIFMAQLDTTIVNVALPTIRDTLHANTGTVTWVLLGYLIPLVSLSLFMGRWLDSGGLQTTFVVFNVGFALASGAVAASPNLTCLIASRVLQGATASGLLAAAPVMAVQAVPEAARGRALGVVSTLAPLGALSGPFLGGQIVNTLGWRSVFLVNIPVALLVVALGYPRRLALPSKPERDWLAEAALLTAAAGIALGAATVATIDGYAWLAAGLLAVIPWAVWRRLAVSADVRRLLSLPAVRAAHVALLTSYTALLAAQFILPFFMQQNLSMSVPTVGLVMMAYPAATAVLGPAAGTLADKTAPRVVATTGAVVLCAAVLLLAPLSTAWTGAAIAWRLAILGIGFALLSTPLQTVALANVQPNRLGLVSATTNVARQIGLSLGPALVTLTWGLDDYHLSGMRTGLFVVAGIAGITLAASVGCKVTKRGSGVEPRTIRPFPQYQQTRKEHIAMSLKVAVIYYSATGNVHALARAVTEGAEKEGAEVRMLKVPELAPSTAIDANPAWRKHAEETEDIPVATLDDLEWADAYAFGSPTRYGNVASQLKQFIDMTGPLWAAGKLSDKAATAFTSAINAHGGNETTLMALYNTMCHWGTVIVPPGYTDSTVSEAGGNPYGTAHASGSGAPTDEALAAAVYQGRRLVRFGAAIAESRLAA